MRSLILAAAFIISGMTALHAADEKELSAHAKAARDFSFDGTKMGTSIEEFMKQHPNATEFKETDRKAGLVCLGTKSDVALGCTYRLFDGKLYEFRIIYEAKDVAKIGGPDVFAKRLSDTFWTNA